MAAAPTSAPAPSALERGDRMLLAAATLFTVAVAVHGFDHLRRGIDATPRDVFWLGTSGIVIEVGIVVVVCARHRAAPLAAAAVGWSLAAAYAVVHFLPERSWASDSFTSAADVSPISWFAASLEVAASLVLGLAGLLVLRDRGGLASAAEPHDGQQPLAVGVRHPVALTMLIADLVILGVSIGQLAA